MNLGTRVAIACAAAVLAVSTNAHAAFEFDTNWTHTVWDPNDGVVLFDHDPGSVWPIVQFDPNQPPYVIESGGVVQTVGGVVGQILQLTIPNFYDPLPVKNLKVMFFGDNPSAQGFDIPRVVDIIGGDSEFGVPAPSLPVIGSFVNGFTEPTQVTEYWTMQPNPDFETVKVFIPETFNVVAVEVWTESIPEPASMALLALGGMAMVRRRR